MNIIFSNQPIPNSLKKSIFLAGPSPRYYIGSVIRTDTWRHRAIDILDQLGYDGVVFVPLPDYAFFKGIASNETIDYMNQVEWEEQAMNMADQLFFYVERTEENIGLTTNIEFGKYCDSGKVVYCRPKDALKVRYFDNIWHKKDKTVFTDMKEGLEDCLDRIGEGVERIDGETLVPCNIFKSFQFQDWYSKHKKLGNYITYFKQTSIITFNDDKVLFGFSAHIHININGEDRQKTNEWIFSRLPVSYVVPFYKDEEGNIHLILTREFRTPANNDEGYVYELPGGSTVKQGVNPIENGAKELEEETGIKIEDIGRFKLLGNRQTFATYLTMNLFALSVELTKEEFEDCKLRVENGDVLGENEEERIRLFITNEKELKEGKYPVDWTTLGLISVLN